MEFPELEEQPQPFHAQNRSRLHETAGKWSDFTEGTSEDNLLERGGLFFHLLSKTKNFLNNQRHENLFLTSILSRLAALPLVMDNRESIYMHYFLFGSSHKENSFLFMIKKLSNQVKTLMRKKQWFEHLVRKKRKEYGIDPFLSFVWNC